MFFKILNCVKRKMNKNVEKCYFDIEKKSKNESLNKF